MYVCMYVCLHVHVHVHVYVHVYVHVHVHVYVYVYIIRDSSLGLKFGFTGPEGSGFRALGSTVLGFRALGLRVSESKAGAFGMLLGMKHLVLSLTGLCVKLGSFRARLSFDCDVPSFSLL